MLSYSPKSGKFPNQTFFLVEAELKLLSDHTHTATPSLTKIHPLSIKKKPQVAKYRFPTSWKKQEHFHYACPCYHKGVRFSNSSKRAGKKKERALNVASRLCFF